MNVKVSDTNDIKLYYLHLYYYQILYILMVEPRDSRIIFLFFLAGHIFWTPLGIFLEEENNKIANWFVHRDNYPVRPKSYRELFSRRSGFRELQLSPLSPLATLKKTVLCSVRKQCSAFCKSDFLYIPIFLADAWWNKFKTERGF